MSTNFSLRVSSRRALSTDARVVSLKKYSSASVKNFLPDSAARHRLAPSRGTDGRAARHFFPVLPALRALALGTLSIGVPCLHSQTSANPAAKAPASSPANKVAATKTSSTKTEAKVAAIKSFRIIQEQNGPAVEILSTQPLVPAIQQLDGPPRLVIDLPNARLDTPYKRVSIQADQIAILRADQYQQNPPVARVVVDLLAPRAYTWDAAGNRLVVHLGKNPTDASRSPFQAPTVASLTTAPQPVVKAVRAAGPLALANDAGNVGSSFTSGADTAVLSLSSGGELRVCPGTTVSITPSQNRHNLMLSMNTGALEAHLDLDASSDSVMTPDFRILLVGPGEFHYAFSTDNQGNTCVRALPGNTASAMVTELMGDRTYQVKATDQLVFRGGQLEHVDMAVPLECGCPPPRQMLERATNDLPTQSSPVSAARLSNAPVVETHVETPPATGVPAANAAPVPAEISAPNELHVQVSTPLVFHATGPPPAPVEDVRALPLYARRVEAPVVNVAPPPAGNVAGQKSRPAGTQTASADHPRGFFHKLGRFFGAMFR
jgi:hypothetical protein